LQVVLLIIIFLAIMGYELPGILRNGWWGELIVFVILLALAFALGMLQMKSIAPPSPVAGIEFLVEQLARLFE
jgi:hypothetical protein